MAHGKTCNKSPCRINHKAIKSKTNTGTLNTETHKNSVRIKAPKSVNASKRKHRNQINHYNKQRRVLMANSTVCQ